MSRCWAYRINLRMNIGQRHLIRLLRMKEAGTKEVKFFLSVVTKTEKEEGWFQQLKKINLLNWYLYDITVLWMVIRKSQQENKWKNGQEVTRFISLMNKTGKQELQ